MSTINEQLHPSTREFILLPGSDVVELLLLLPAEQVVQLELLARGQGLTMGQMLRRAIQSLLNTDLVTVSLTSQQAVWRPDSIVQGGGIADDLQARRPDLMCGELSTGDRVRISQQNRLPPYQPGDTGTIRDTSLAAGGQARYYLVIMDQDDPPQPILFAEDEIEPVGGDTGSGPVDSL
jgi:hypothetical protein